MGSLYEELNWLDCLFYIIHLMNFKGDRNFLGIYFFEKSFEINLGNYRNCSGKFLLIF